MKRLDSFVNDLFDILISSVKIGGDVVKEEIDLVKKTCSNEDKIWNGGVTNLKGSGIDDSNDGITDTPYDEEEFEFVEMHGPSTVIYDGLYDDDERDRGEIKK